jgi:flagellar protein FlaG
VKEAVNEIQRYIGKSSTNVTFAVDESSGRTIVSVVDTETREIIRQMPTKEVLQIARALGRLQGMLFNGKA